MIGRGLGQDAVRRVVLTGRSRRFEDLAPDDFPRSSPRFQGENSKKNLDLVDRMGEIAKEKGVTAGQLALAWVWAQGRDIVPIPGTTHVAHLEENVAALKIRLTDSDLSAIREAMPKGLVSGTSYPEAMMKWLNP
jgi:aryl-alcohol dehydrogenase-like predicted oxidoreductase